MVVCEELHSDTLAVIYDLNWVFRRFHRSCGTKHQTTIVKNNAKDQIVVVEGSAEDQLVALPHIGP
jgi:hypothetical protein